MSQSSEKGRILFIPMCTHGHINYAVPIANRFLELYGDHNEVYFALNEEYKNKVEKLAPNAKFVVYEDPEEKKLYSNSQNWLIDVMQKFGETWSDDLIKYVHSSAFILGMNFKSLCGMYEIMTKLIEEIKPDFIIFDQLFSVPYGRDLGIKWGNLFSAALNYIGCPKMPPPQSGLPTEYNSKNLEMWEDFLNKAYRTGPYKTLKDQVSNFLKEKGLKGLDDHYFVYEFSPYLNIYGYPKELDYLEAGITLPGKWLRIETPVVKPFPSKFPIPEKLKNLPGKLIYFSLGSMASVYKPLMEKMLSILEQLPHRFIISTVDMVISHGGNNTLTETFNFGLPLIFVPLFGDQPDNAQRMHDKGLGVRCNIFDDTEKLKQDLIDAIEYCSRDSVILKMKKASERIQKDSGLDRVCEELAKLVQK